MTTNRGTEHIRYALEQKSSYNSFDEVELIRPCLFMTWMRLICLQNLQVESGTFPFISMPACWVEAIGERNQSKLAQVAEACGICL